MPTAGGGAYRTSTAARRRAHTSAATRLAWALAILSATLAVASVALATFNGEGPMELVASHHAIGIVNALVLPLVGALFLLAGVGIGILRYRLWDIDRLVNCTLVYGLLTAILAGCYALGVLVLGHTLSAGRSPSSLVVAATTLVVAALFQPLRRRIQRAVDRRFNRRHYDAARTIEAFATRLREHTDLHTLSGEVLTVVDHTLQPTQVSLWLRPTGPPPPAPEQPSWTARLVPATGRDRAGSRSGVARPGVPPLSTTWLSTTSP